MACVFALASCDPQEEDAAESAAGSESDDSDSDTTADAGCQRGGLAQPGADVLAGSFYGSIALVTPDSNAAAGGGSVRFGLPSGDVALPPRDEVEGFVNGCPIEQEAPEGDEIFFGVSGADVPVELVAGGNFTIEIRHGDHVLLRRTGELPSTLPAFTSPAEGAAITPPVTLAWTPIGLDDLGVASTELGVTGWVFEASGSSHTDGHLDLVDADGTATWTAGSADWTHLQLQARVDYGDGFSFGVSHYQPVNGPQ